MRAPPIGKPQPLATAKPVPVGPVTASRGVLDVARLRAGVGNQRLLAYQEQGRAVLQRECERCEEEDEKRGTLQRSAADTAGPSVAPASVHATLRAPGEALPASMRSAMERSFGVDFSDVRVHADPAAGRSARDVGARAYTVGRHIVFAGGEYRPSARSGQRLLAHELGHVVQQKGSAAIDGPIEIGAPGTSAEREADAASTHALAGLRARVSPIAGNQALLQRFACADLIAAEGPFIEERLVQARLHEQVPTLEREFPIPGASFSHYRDPRPPVADPSAPPGSTAGLGYADFAFMRGRTLELAEMKPAMLEFGTYGGLVEGERQLAHYVEHANATDLPARQWRTRRRITRAVPMPTAPALPSPLQVGDREVRVGWCAPGLIGFKAVPRADDAIFVCAGSDQGRIDNFISRTMGRAEGEVDRFIDETVDRQLTRVIETMPIRDIITRLWRSPQARELVEMLLGPGSSVILDQVPIAQLALMIEQQIDEETARFIRRIALDTKARLLHEVRERLRRALHDTLQEGIVALCATVAAFSMRDLLDWLRRNLPRRFAEEATVVVAAVAQRMARELVTVLAQALAIALAVVLAIVLAIVAIELIVAGGVIAALEAALDAAIAGVVLAVRAVIGSWPVVVRFVTGLGPALSELAPAAGEMAPAL